MKLLTKLVRLIVRMLRPRTVLMLGLFLLTGWSAVAKQQFGWQLLLLALALAAWFTNATCINDLADVEIDKINLKHDSDRPLVHNDTSRRSLVVLALAAGLVATASATLVRPLLGAFMVGTLVLNWAYSMPPLRISYRGFLAALLLPIGYVCLPFFSGALAAPHQVVTTTAIGTGVGLYVAFIGRILLKDFRDVEGDKKFGKRTFLVRHDAPLTCLVAAMSWLAGDAVLIAVLHDRQVGFVLLVQPFIIAILFTLRILSRAADLEYQLLLVGMVGKLGNAMLLLLLIFETITVLAIKQGEAIQLVGAILLVCLYLVLLQYDGLHHYRVKDRQTVT